MKRDRQAGLVESIAERVRNRAQLMGIGYSDLMKGLEIPSSSMANYWSGKRPWPLEQVSDLADVLATSVDALLGRSNANVAPAGCGQGDWIAIPQYDLSAEGERGKGEQRDATYLRREWLTRSLGRDTDLWLTALPADYPALGLREGDQVICHDIERNELRERQLCLWLLPLLGKFVVGRYSLIHRGNHVLVMEGEEYWVNPHLVEGDVQWGIGADLIPVGKIVGKPLAPIR